MSRNRFFFILTFIIAVALRFVFLGWKPPHFDESINGWFVMQVWDKGYYNYDPTNFHGPLYFYYLQLFEMLFGRSVEVMRAATGLISLGIIYLVFAHRRFVGAAAYWAALFVAISPAFVFYSRYAIHESLFVFAQILFSLGFFNWREKRSWFAYMQMTASFVILASTKETFFIFLGTWAIAIASLKVIGIIDQKVTGGAPLTEEPPPQVPLTQTEKWRMVQVSIAAVVVIYALFSNLFADPSAFKEFFNAFAVWTKTGAEGKSGHEKPFFYWIELLKRYEWPILVALVLSPFAFILRNGFHLRILALVGFGTWLAYSIIPYKTPWLIMGMLWPLAFVLGWLLELRQVKAAGKILIVVLALFVISPLIQTYRLNFVEYTNDQEQYVYVQSTQSMKTVIDLVEQQVKRSPADFNMQIEVMTGEGWPFPWVFGRFPNLHFMKIGALEVDRVVRADVILYDGKDSVKIEELLADEYYRIPLQLRSAYLPSFALFRVKMFKGLLPASTIVKEKQP